MIRSIRAGLLAAACAALLGVAACEDAPVDERGGGSAEDSGDFVVRDAVLTDDQYIDLVSELDEQALLQNVADGLNESLNLPEDIGLKWEQCGEDNAWYDPETRDISICIEMFEAQRDIMSTMYETDEEIETAVQGSFLFTVYHEVGHALVDVLEIPITGREEDAVDQMSAWWLIGNDEGEAAAIDGALSFYTDPAEAEAAEEGEYADEHSLSQQRYYNLTCWVYGSDPEGYSDLLEYEWLTPERAERCPDEFAVLDRSWYALLEDHLKG